MRKIITVLFCSGLLGLSACGVFQKDNYQDLNHTQWTLSELKDVEAENLAQAITIKFDNGKVNGFAGCNGYSGVVKQQQTMITISEIMGTFKACNPGSVTEGKFLEVLRKANTVNIKKGKMQLKEDKKILAEFVEVKK